MIIAKSIVSLLNTATPVTDIVGTRIYPALAPQGGGFPAILYDFEAAEPDITLDGPGRLVKQTLTVSALSTAYSTTDNLANEIRNALDGLGAIGFIVAGIEVLDIQWSGESENNQQLTDVQQESTIFIKEIEFIVQFNMPAPTGNRSLTNMGDNQLGSLSDEALGQLAD